MIIPSEIVKHIKTYLPIFTDRFTDFIAASSASVDASNIVTVVSAWHGKSAGQSVVVSDGDVRNPLSASALDGSTVKFTTKYEHDLTKPSQPLDDQTVTLDGFGSVWDDTFDIVEVKSRTTFNVNLPTGETLAPAVNESQYLIEERKAGLNNVQTVATVPDVNTFTINLSGVPNLPVGPIDNFKIVSGFRIAAAADFRRAQAIYTEQPDGDDYLFVIMTDGDVSKDRHTMNDGVAGLTVQDLNFLRVLRNFSTVIFMNTSGDLSGADAQDLIYGDIYAALLSTLFGFQDQDAFVQYGAVPVGDGPAEYNTAYYAHTYDWQLPVSITYQDGFLQQPDVAFRDIVQTLKLFNDSEAEMISNINLDEES